MRRSHYADNMGSIDYLRFNGYTVSAYSTIDLSDEQAITLIAKHMGVYDERFSSWQLLEQILFKITDENEFSPYRWNNYHVTNERNLDIEL